jgi:hypothetical protein
MNKNLIHLISVTKITKINFTLSNGKTYLFPSYIINQQLLQNHILYIMQKNVPYET